MNCKNCQSTHQVKQGIAKGKQRYKCKDCGYCYREGDNRTSPIVSNRKMIATVLYSNGGMTIRGLAKILKS
jgi:transposase